MNPQQQPYIPQPPQPQPQPNPNTTPLATPQPAAYSAVPTQPQTQAPVPPVQQPQQIYSTQQPTPQSAAQPAPQQPLTYRPPQSAQTPATPVQQPFFSGRQPMPTAPAPVSPMAQIAAPTRVPDNPNSTQSTLLISELRDGLVIMKDGSFRAVVACKSINFDLMSSTEREGIEYSYQNFINSLTFPTQILIRSQRVDIGPYLERLTEIRKNNDNMLLGVLMDDYINFVDVLSQEANIMDKSFFIIIPYHATEESEKISDQTKNFFSIFRKNPNAGITKIDRQTYDKAVAEINNRVESVISGLFQIGIHSVRLNTRELSELYYNFNNPDTAVREPFIDFSKVATTYVRKSEGVPPQGEQQNG